MLMELFDNKICNNLSVSHKLESKIINNSFNKKSLLYITMLLQICIINDVIITMITAATTVPSILNFNNYDVENYNNKTKDIMTVEKDLLQNIKTKRNGFNDKSDKMRNKRNSSLSLIENTIEFFENDTKNVSSHDSSTDWLYTTVKMDYTENELSLSNDDYFINQSDYDDEECFSLECMPYDDYVDRIRQEVINPSMPEWIFVGAHSVVFLVGLIGNALVCVAVYRNHSMRTVTNYFIVNLAVADFMVILFCLPPTVIWDITSTWFFGIILCKVVLYLQNVSVTVSVLTLTFISIDRWYAICYPLKFKSTTGRAKTAIIVIWLIALSTDIPEFLVLTTVKLPQPNITEVYYTQCDVQWSTKTDTIWNISKTIILYIIPLIFMSFAYCQIVRVLWRTDKALVHNSNINNQSSSSNDNHHHNHHHHHHNNQQRYHPPTSSSGTTTNTTRGNHDNGNNARGVTCTTRRSTFLMNSNTTTEGQLRSRRKAAKMLVAVVVMFAVCYFPVHFLNLIRHLIVLEQTDCNAVLVLIAHWLIYANSAVNPVIYNFMSGKFRREFRRAFAQCHCVKNQLPNQYHLNNFSPHSTKSKFRKEFQTTFGCWCFRKRRFNRRRQTTMTRSSTYICRFTTTAGGSTNAKTEVIPLSNLPHSIVRRESDY